MKKAKTTKRALLSAVLALVLCMSMFVGTTFAWFTDSVTSSNNVITAGNLDIELEYAVFNDDGTFKEWKDVEKAADILSNNLWEPGVTEVAYLRLANAGSLALKYQLGVNIVSETEGVNKAGKTFKLSDYIYFDVVENVNGETGKYATREDAMKNATETTLISAGYVKATTMAPNDELYLALVVYMPESVGNDANHNGTNVPKIDLGINVIATQTEAEDDSFGNDYDKNAWANGMKVYTASDLQAAINAGENVVLMNDIELTESIVIPAPAASTLSLRATPVAQTIDLNGKTVKGSFERATGVIINNGNLVLKNGTVTSVAINGASAVLNKGNLTLENVTVNGAPSDTANSGTAAYAVNTAGAASTLTINSANISGRGAIGATNGAKVTINGGTYNVPAPAWGHCIYAVGEGTEVVINGGTFSEGFDSAPNDWTYMIYAGESAKVDVKGGNFSAWDSAAPKDLCVASDGVIEVSGGTFGFDPSNQGGTNHVVDGYKAVANNDGTYSVIFPQDSFDNLIKDAAADATIDVPAGEYTFPGTDLKAGQTLNCAEGTVFENGTGLNANGATIIGATFSNPAGTAGTGTVNGTFKNCTFDGSNGLRWCNAGDTVVFENCVFSGDVYGVHFDGGENDVIFRNCTFSGFNAFGSAITKLTMEGCTFKANGRSGYNGANLWGNTEMTNCTFVFDGTVTEWIDMCSAGTTGTFNGCVVTDGVKTMNFADYVSRRNDDTIVLVDGAYLANNNVQLTNAVNAGATKVLLTKDGDYDLNGIQKDGLTLVGVGDGVEVANNTKYASGKATGAIWKAINLENVTITNTVYTMADGSNATFTKVNFAAGFRQGYGKNVVFTDCVFGSNSEGYALHFQTDSASEGGNITLTDCEFEGGKVHLGGKRAYTFTGCDFAAGTDFQVWSNITLDGCTVDGVAVTAENVATLFPNLNMAKVTLN